MDPMSEDFEQLLQRLREAGEKLTEEFPTRFLRPFQRQLDSFQYTLRNKHLKFLCFFLSSFIGDVYDNLAGDVPPHEDIHHGRNEVLTQLGETLIALVPDIECGDYGRCYERCAELVDFYLRKIQELNSIPMMRE
jgi:hypothetical protein